MFALFTRQLVSCAVPGVDEEHVLDGDAELVLGGAPQPLHLGHQAGPGTKRL